MPPRHGFVQVPSGRRIEERNIRAGDSTYGIGYVEEAAYLGMNGNGWLARWTAALLGRAGRDEATLRRPFDEDGGDALGLLADPPAPLGPPASRSEGPRRVVGRVSLPTARGSIAVDDAWFGSDEETWRVTEGVDFVLTRGADDPIVVSFGLAPLVIDRPEPVELAEHLRGLAPSTRKLLPGHLATRGAGQRVRVAAGETVEVWGVCRGLFDSHRTFDLSGDYRNAPRPARVVGDEDGTRLVIVKRGPEPRRGS